MTEKIRKHDGGVQGGVDEGHTLQRALEHTGETPNPRYTGIAGQPDAGPLRGTAPVKVQIDGVLFDGLSGELLVDAINRAKIELSQVCYHPQLGSIQTCDTCIVEVDGVLSRACGTPVRAGMTVRTQTTAARSAQREGMDRILANHDLYCTVCDNSNGNCTVHNTVELLQIEHQARPWEPKPYAKDDSNPFYRYDPDQCILCGRCVEACQNLQVNETLSINWEDKNPRVLWDGGQPIGDSSCVSCGHCVTVCPCNALQEKSMLGVAGLFTGIPLPVFDAAVGVVKGAEPSTGYGPIFAVSEIEAAAREEFNQRTKTVCTYCGVGCSFEVWTQDRHILKVEPLEGPANGVSTCIKGKFGWDYVNSKDRLTSPLIRDGDGFREVSWEEATQYIARRMSEIKNAHGEDALAFIASSKCTNEEAYLMGKLARQVIGTNNIDNCSRYCQSPATMGLWRTVGYGGDSGTIKDIEAAELVIIVGSNTAESHPVLATRVKRAHKLHGQKLIVADLRKNEMAERADLHLHPKPGSDFIWVSAVAKYLLDNNLAAQDFLDQHVNGLEEFRTSVAEFTLEYAEQETGVSVATLKQVADMIHASSGTCILWAMGVTQQMTGSETSTAISNLLLVSGNYMRTGTGAYPLRGHNNVQGASDMGAMPAHLPGYQHVEDDEARGKFEAAWGVKIKTEMGLDNTLMIHEAHAGKLKSLYLVGEDLGLVDANANFTSAALSNLEFFVIQDLFFSETAKFADVVLPASPSLEKEGTFTNTERRIQRLYQVMPPLKGSKPDWEAIQMVAQALGADWNYTHPSEIMAEAAVLMPILSGVTYERLEGFKSLCWPVHSDGTDTPLLYTEGFHFPDKKARLYPARFIPRTEPETSEYDLHVNNGRMLEHFHEGMMTFKSAGITSQVPDSFVELSPALAAERGVETGQFVRLISRSGAIRLRALVSERVEGKELYVPMNAMDSSQMINFLTGSHTDPATHTPAYKDLSVRMEVLPAYGENPLPKHNHRYHRATPQKGVEVQRKWARPDYAFPGSSLPLTGASLNSRADGLGADD
jgi:formate dehydrogenase major subunit